MPDSDDDNTIEHLEDLIADVKTFLKSAENALAAVKAEKEPKAVKAEKERHPVRYETASQWAKGETERLGRMVRTARIVNDGLEPALSTRMRFLEGVQFFSETLKTEVNGRTVKQRADMGAERLISDIKSIDSNAARRLDPKKVSAVIQAKARPGKKWPWKKIVEAWHVVGEKITTEGTWRSAWDRYENGRK